MKSIKNNEELYDELRSGLFSIIHGEMDPTDFEEFKNLDENDCNWLLDQLGEGPKRAKIWW